MSDIHGMDPCAWRYEMATVEGASSWCNKGSDEANRVDTSLDVLMFFFPINS